MGIFNKIFAKGRLKIPARHRTAAYMNLAFDILPTAVDVTPNAWDTPPVDLRTLTDENYQTHFATPGVHDDADQTYIEIDLGDIYEIYEIIVQNGGAAIGYNKAIAGADVDFHLVTSISDDVTAGTVRDTQTVPGDGANHDNTLHYVGEGIPARYVYIEFTGEVGDVTTVDLSQIEVFGC